MTGDTGTIIGTEGSVTLEPAGIPTAESGK